MVETIAETEVMKTPGMRVDLPPSLVAVANGYVLVYQNGALISPKWYVFQLQSVHHPFEP